jgi:hypothetical protein
MMSDKKLKLNYVDIETAALPIEILRPRMPEFSAPERWKDEEKISQEIDRQRAKWLDDCALSPLTGQILAAVWVDEFGEQTILDADEIGEHDLICHLFARFRDSNMGAHYKVAGFNLRDFDWPFLIKRAWANRVEIPTGMLRLSGKWADMPPWIIDIRDLWGMGERHASGSLGVIAEFFGVGEKMGEGKDFARHWRDPLMHAEALAYLQNDGRITKAVTDHLLSLSLDSYGLNLQTRQ